MINTTGNKWEPSPGYKYITDGTVYTDSIFLGAADSIEHWHDTNDEPPEPGTDDPIDDADYIEAAKILLGVSE